MTAGFRLLSWNTYNKRRSPDAALALFHALAPDVLCLQEVNAALLELLRGQADWQVHSARDFTERGTLSWLVTATAWRSSAVQLPVNEQAATSPSLLGRISGWAESLDALSTHLPEANLTFVNLHLSCAAGPAHRLTELRRVLAQVPSDRLVVCGDFNSFANGSLKLLGPLFGFRREDYRGRESQRLVQALSERGLRPLPSRRPTARFALTLDHVALTGDLIPGAAIEVLPERHGSDHHPMLAILPMARPV